MASLDDIPMLGVIVASGCGLLIGLERERRKGAGADREAAGIRTFTIVAASGAIAQGTGIPGLVAVGALFVAALAALAHAKSRSSDPGLTTETALFATYLIGVVCVLSPTAGGACGATLAGLLAARSSLHSFATRLLSEDELRDGLLLAALGLVVLPLVPNVAVGWLADINPRPLAGLVFLILLLQAAGHVALRWLGPERGVLVSGFASGFVSSTVTIATLGRRAREERERGSVLASAAALSTSATWVQALVMSGALSPHAARVLAPAAVTGALAAIAVGVGWYLLGRRKEGQRAPSREEADRRALRLREALSIAAILTVVTLLVTFAQRRFGSTGVLAGAAVGGLADAHAPVASLTAMHVGGQLGERELLLGVIIAVSANSATRAVVAFTSGGWRYGARVALSLAVGLAAAWITAV